MPRPPYTQTNSGNILNENAHRNPSMKTTTSHQFSHFNKHKFPLVTIGVPTYNRSAGLLRTIESIKTQNYPNLDILISDNGSTDNTPEVCQNLAIENSNVRFVRHNKNRGITFNFQYVLSIANGEFFMFHSDDDTLNPDVLPQYVDFLVHNPDFVLVSGNVNFWDNERLHLTEKDFDFTSEDPAERILSFYRKVLHTGIYHGLMRREVAAAYPLNNVMATDWYFLAALLSQGKMRNLEISAYNKRFGGTSDTFEKYAQNIGSGKFSAYNPMLYMAWKAAMDILNRKAILPNYSTSKKLCLATRVFWCIFNRFYTQKLLKDPIHFFRSVGGALAKTLLPPSATALIKKYMNKEQKSQCYP